MQPIPCPRPSPQRPARLATALLAASALLACAQPVPPSTAPAPAPAPAPAAQPAPTSPADSRLLLIELRNAIGTALCDEDSQCHSLGVGAKPCGGPDGWIAWSSKTTDGKLLLALAERQREARRTENLASGRLSNCMISVDPGAQCRPRQDGLKVCQTGQGGAPGGN